MQSSPYRHRRAWSRFGRGIPGGGAKRPPDPQRARKPTPPVPAGLKVTCTLGPGTGQPSPNCPVILYGGVRTWAYSFIDNRLAFGVVSFDPNGNILKNVTRNGARYVYKMTVDPIAQAVSSSNCQRLGPVQCQNRYRLARPAGDPTPGRQRTSQLLATGSRRLESNLPERP